MLDILARQVASPVQFIKGLRTLYEAGARVFVEVGPKKALHGFVEDVLGERSDVLALFTNHPKFEDARRSTRRCAASMRPGWGRRRVDTATWKPSAIRVATIARAARPVVDHRRVPGAAGDRAHFRRQQRGPDPARRAVHRRHSDALPPRHAGQAHHAPGEERQRRARPSSRSTSPGRRDQAGGARRRVRSWQGVRRDAPSASRRSTASPAWPSRRASMRCAMRASR